MNGWDQRYRTEIAKKDLKIESLEQKLLEKFKEEYEQEEEGGRARLKIAGKGGSPGQPYDDPEKGKGPFVPAPPRDKLMIAHGEHFDEYGQPIQDPTRGMDPSGNPITIPHLQQTPEEHERNKQLHMDKYHQAMAGPDYIGDKLRYGQLDRILNPLGDFRKPTLDQLRMHKDAYPKAQSPQDDLKIAGLNLGGGRFLHNYEIKMLRDHFTGASEKERNRLIEMYSDKPFRGLV